MRALRAATQPRIACVSVVALFASAGCQAALAGDARVEGSGGEGSVERALPDDVAIEPLTEGVWTHTSYRSVDGYGEVPSRGLIVLTTDHIVLIDTAWSDEQTRVILGWIRAELGRFPDALVATHAHQDKMGGVQAAHDVGVRSYALARSNELAPGRGLVPARVGLDLAPGEARQLGGYGLEVFYPGAGHSEDNLVVYVPAAQVLHGGCLIRPADATSLGNTADATLAHWDAAVGATLARYRSARFVVASHGAEGVGGVELLSHTIDLVVAHRAAADAPREAP